METNLSKHITYKQKLRLFTRPQKISRLTNWGAHSLLV